jgi:HK97 family phage prohead protease/HK97 family phage major capsid protein
MAKYRGKTINLVPTDGMKSEALRGLAWRDEGKPGGTLVGMARANQLKNKTELSPRTVRRMFSFFSRHEVDKQAQGFSPGEEGYPSKGRVAWALWGGDAGFSWSRSKVAQLDRLDGKSLEMPEEEDPEEETPEEEDSEDEVAGMLIEDNIDSIIDVSDKLYNTLGDEDNLPGHIISKIILATDYIRDARDYVKMEEKQLDPEYDYEGAMAKDELRILISAAQEIKGLLTEEVSLPKYLYDKVILAETYIKDSYEYLNGKKAGPDELKVGDFVEWNSSGGMARGKIKKIVRDGETGIQGISGTPDNPAAVITVWRKSGEEYEESDVEVAHKFSTLKKIRSLMKQNKIFTIMSKVKTVSQNASTIKIRGMASTKDIDRVGDIVEPDAWTKGGLKNYTKNPIILFNHDYNKPIGKGTDFRVTKDGLEITAEISKADPYIAQLIEDGVLSTFSIGFKVKDADYMKDTGGLLIKDVELFEVSVVSVPANQAATFEVVKSYSQDEFDTYKKGLLVPVRPVVGQNEGAMPLQGKKKMDEEELKALIARQVSAAVKTAEQEREALADKARKEAEVAKAQEEAVTKVAAAAGVSGAERLLEEVRKTFAAGQENTQKEIEELKRALADRSAEVNALQNSKRVFVQQNEKDWQKAFESDLRTAKLLGVALGNKGIRDTKFGQSVLEKATNAMSSVAAPTATSIEVFENIVSTSVERDIQNGLVLAPLFREIQMQAATMSLPILPDSGYAEFTAVKSPTAAAPQGNIEERGDTYGSPWAGVDLTQKTISTKKLISITYLANETEEDTVLAILPLINETMVRSHQRAVEHAMLLGNHTQGVYGNGGTSFAGLAAHALANSLEVATGTTPFTSAALTSDDLLVLRKSLGKYGVRPNEVIYIVSQRAYFELLQDAEFQDTNLVNLQATKLTGEVGNIYGSKVLLCDEFPTPAATKLYAMAVNPRNYIVPRLRGVTLESQYVPRLQHRELVATQRLGMDTIISGGTSAASRKYGAT